MTKLIPLVLLFFVCVLKAFSQTPATFEGTMPYGKIKKADLEMKSCDFEADANAEVLFDKASITIEQGAIVTERHKRIKIFNSNGVNAANIRIEYIGFNGYEYIHNLEAETINLSNGNEIITKVDKKSIYTENIDRLQTALIFTLPDVKAGSVIEYKYQLTCNYYLDFPSWYFQGFLPTRYSELQTNLVGLARYKRFTKTTQPYAKTEGSVTDDIQLRALSNVPSIPDEPFTASRMDNLQRVDFQYDFMSKSEDKLTWSKIGEIIMGAEWFGDQLSVNLAGQDSIMRKVNDMKFDDEKILYIFNAVKNRMKWNNVDSRSTDVGTARAWNKQVGNSTEINLILYSLLKKAKINVFPMIVCTKIKGLITPSYPNPFLLNKAVAYVPVDSTKCYVLDASDKFNLYNEMPKDLLNSYGLCINKTDKEQTHMVYIEKGEPAMQSLFVNAEIKAGGKITGSVDITSFSYNKSLATKDYKINGETKYIEALGNKNGNLKITGLKLENLEVDSLPLMQHYDFTLNLTAADESYIYFNPNQLANIGPNPFLAETRKTDIDFGYRNNFAINGVYKVPSGYKIDALPKTTRMAMEDNSISFKRTIAEQDGSISVRYVLDFKKSKFNKDDYPEIYAFYKKMYEMMNEDIVLKKI